MSEPTTTGPLPASSSLSPPPPTSPPAVKETKAPGLRVAQRTRSAMKAATAGAVQFSNGSESATEPPASPMLPADPITDKSPRTDTPSPGPSAPEQVKIQLGKELLREILRNAVQTMGEALHLWLTTSALERDMDLYLAEEDDKANIGDPLAEIARRRLGNNLASPDAADMIRAGIGLVAYAQKNVHRKVTIWRAVRKYKGEHAAGIPAHAPRGAAE